MPTSAKIQIGDTFSEFGGFCRVTTLREIPRFPFSIEARCIPMETRTVCAHDTQDWDTGIGPDLPGDDRRPCGYSLPSHHAHGTGGHLGHGKKLRAREVLLREKDKEERKSRTKRLQLGPLSKTHALCRHDTTSLLLVNGPWYVTIRQ